MLIYSYISAPVISRRLLAAISDLPIFISVNLDKSEVGDSGQGLTTEVTTDGVVRPYILALNTAAMTCKMYTPVDIVSAGFYNGPPTGITTQLGGTSFSTPTAGILYAAEFAGAAAEFSDSNVRSLFQALGWTVYW